MIWAALAATGGPAPRAIYLYRQDAADRGKTRRRTCDTFARTAQPRQVRLPVDRPCCGLRVAGCAKCGRPSSRRRPNRELLFVHRATRVARRAGVLSPPCSETSHAPIHHLTASQQRSCRQRRPDHRIAGVKFANTLQVSNTRLAQRRRVRYKVIQVYAAALYLTDRPPRPKPCSPRQGRTGCRS